MLKECNPKAFKKLDFKSKYVNARQKMIFGTAYGDVKVLPCNLISGYVPCIMSAVDKTQYWINQAIEIHGDRYDYSLVEYISGKKKVKIICTVHGVFDISPDSHLHKSANCIKCAKQSAKGIYSNKKILERNKVEYKNTPSELYILKLKKEKEIFFKIGVTKQNITARSGQMGVYKSTVIKTIKTNLYDAAIKEQELLENFKEYQYIPEHKFGGYTECFSINPLEKLKIELTDF